MVKKKKILLGTLVLCLAGSAPAYAQLNVDVSLGQPAYVAPAPAYVSPYPTYYDPHHRNHDFAYWHPERSGRPDVRHDAHR